MQIFENPTPHYRGVPGGMRRVRGGEEGEEGWLVEVCFPSNTPRPPGGLRGLAGGAADSSPQSGAPAAA